MKTFVVAKVFIVNEQGELLLLRRSQSDTRRPGQWDFPGGWVNSGEDVRAAAERETYEESGIRIEHGRLVYAITEAVPVKGSGTWLVFLARVAGHPAVTLSSEHDDHTWLKLEEVAARLDYERQKRMVQYVVDNNLLEGEVDADA